MSPPVSLMLAVSALSRVSSDSRQPVHPQHSSQQLPHTFHPSSKQVGHTSYSYPRHNYHQQPQKHYQPAATSRYHSAAYTRQQRGLPGLQTAASHKYQRKPYQAYQVDPRIIHKNYVYTAQQKRPRKLANIPLKSGITSGVKTDKSKDGYNKKLNSAVNTSKHLKNTVVDNPNYSIKNIAAANPDNISKNKTVKKTNDKFFKVNPYSAKKKYLATKKHPAKQPQVTHIIKPATKVLQEKSFKASPKVPKFIIKPAGPSQQFGWVGHGEFAPLNIPNIFKAAGLNTKWIPEENNIFEAGLLYPVPAQDKLLVEPVETEPKKPYFSVSKNTTPKSVKTVKTALSTKKTVFPTDTPSFTLSSPISRIQPNPSIKELSTSQPDPQIKLSSNTFYKVISSAPPTYDTSTASKEPQKQTTTVKVKVKFPTLWRSSTPGYKGLSVSADKYNAPITYKPPTTKQTTEKEQLNPFLEEKKLPSISLPSFKSVENPAVPPQYEAVETPAIPPNYIAPRNPFLKKNAKRPPAPVYYPKTTNTPITSSSTTKKVKSYGSQTIDLSKYQKNNIIKTTTKLVVTPSVITFKVTTSTTTTPKNKPSKTTKRFILSTEPPTTSSYLYRSSPSLYTPGRPSYQPAPAKFPIYPSVIQEAEKEEIPVAAQLTEDQRLREVPDNTARDAEIATAKDDEYENLASVNDQAGEKEDDEVFFIFYENEQNPVEETFANSIDLKRFIQEELNNPDPDTILSASVPEGDIFSDPNEVPVFSVIEEVDENFSPTKLNNPVFYDVPIKIEESGEGFDPPSEIRTIFVPIENAINVPNTYDISVGTSFGYNKASEENSFSSFLSGLDAGYDSAYDNPISSYDAPIAPTSQGTAFEIPPEVEVNSKDYSLREKKPVRRVRKPKSKRKSRKQKLYPEEAKESSERKSLPYGTRVVAREKYNPLDIIKRK